MGKLTIAVGKEQVYLDRAIATALEAARNEDPSVTRIDIKASDEDAPQELAAVLVPSLFGDRSLVVVAATDATSDDFGQLLEATLKDLPEHVDLVLLHPGGVKGKRYIDLARKAGAVEVSCASPSAKELQQEIVAEFRRHKRTVTPGGLAALQSAVGNDLGLLVGAISQLCADVEGDPIDESSIAEYFAGISEVSSWRVSDSMWNAQPVEVLEQLRWALSNDSSAAVPIVISLISGLRALVAYASSPGGMSEQQLAAAVGVPPWKLKILKAQKNRWTPTQLAQAAVLLTEAERAAKGTEYDRAVIGGRSLDDVQKQYRIEQLVAAIQRQRSEQ